MINFQSITSDDLKYICNQISFKAARQYFQMNPKLFAEIRPGFRPETLSDSATFSILVKNVSKPFISNFLSIVVSKWISQIQENVNNLIEEGYTEDEALLITIPDSVFCDNCALFFKFVDKDRSDDYIRLFRESLSLRQKEKEEKMADDKNKELQAEVESVNNNNERIVTLNQQLEESQKAESNLLEEVAVVKRELEGKILEIEALNNSLKDAEFNMNQLNEELNHFRTLSNYADEYVQDESSTFQHTTIGEIHYDYHGSPRIFRLADIVDGEIIPFECDEKAPRYFNNRDWIFWKNGPDEEGSIGIWNWSAIPNISDPTKDYITSEYNPYAKYIEIVDLPQCKDLSEVSNYLSDWFTLDFSGGKILFTCRTLNGTIEGLLCTSQQLQFNGNSARLLASVYKLPQYTINSSDIIVVSRIHMYRKMSLGFPQSIHRVRSPYDVVKKLLLSRVKISALRENGLTNKEAQKCKHYLETIPNETLIQDLLDVYECTESEAQEYVDGFIEHAETYLNENDLDLDIVSQALARNPALIELCKKQLSEDWEKEYSEKIKQAEEKIDILQSKMVEKKQEIETLLQKEGQLNNQIEEKEKRIEEINSFANEVEENVSVKINYAKQNAAEFISQMSFLEPLINHNSVNKSYDKRSIPIFKSKIEHLEEEPVDDLDSFVDELIQNFVSIGYEESSAVDIAECISFCICNQLPILVANNSAPIAQCIATTIGGKELTEVFVSDQSTIINTLYDLMDRNETNCPLVYLIHGVFDGYNINLFNEVTALLRQLHNKVIILLSIQGIEPKMLFEKIWAEAFFIEGDSGLNILKKDPIQAVDPQFEFNRNIDEKEYRKISKELQPFSSVLTNIQSCLYAKYMASYGVHLNECPTILNQMIVISQSSGKEDILSDLFRENGINKGEEMVKKYL